MPPLPYVRFLGGLPGLAGPLARRLGERDGGVWALRRVELVRRHRRLSSTQRKGYWAAARSTGSASGARADGRLLGRGDAGTPASRSATASRWSATSVRRDP